jgi:hypothetical protein
MATQYVLFCRGETIDPEDLRRIAARPGVKILRHVVPRVMLIETTPEIADELRAELKGWIVSEPRTYRHPFMPGKKPGPGDSA